MIKFTVELFQVIPATLAVEQHWITREYPTLGFSAQAATEAVKLEFPTHTIAASKRTDLGLTCGECVHFGKGYCWLPQRRNSCEPRNSNSQACDHFYDKTADVYANGVESLEDEF